MLKRAAVIGAAAVAIAIAVAIAVMRSQSSPEVATYNNAIGALLHASCAPCHRPNGIGPFALLTYADASAHASEIEDVVESRYMPPWLPKPGYGDHQRARRLRDEDRARLLSWIARGAPEGSGTSPAPPSFPPDGFKSGTPDLVLEMPEPYTLAAEGTDVYRNIVFPVPIDAPRFVRAIELLPGNARVVHHAIIQIDQTDSVVALDAADPGIGFSSMQIGSSQMPDGQLLIWTPGKNVVGTPGLTWRLDPGSYLVVQLHLQTTGKPELVRSTIGLFFSEQPPNERAVLVELHSANIDIPANGTFEVERRFRLPIDFDALAIFAHAHFLGKEVQAYATLPNGERTWLLWIDRWDFRWQEEYNFAQPVHLPRGSELVMRWTYDNTEHNQQNPARPPVRVLYGERSQDEMASVWIHGLARSVDDGRLARSELAQSALAREIEDLRAMTAADPENRDRFVWLANDLAKLHRFEEAKTEYEHALHLGAIDPFQRSGYAGVLRRLGALDAASKELTTAIEENPRLSELHSNLGVTEMARGHREQAIAEYRRALELRPRYAEGHFNLGNALADGGELDAALASFDRAIALRPDFEEAQTNAGLALMRMGKKAEALARFQRAAELAPESPRVQKNLELALQANGRAMPAPPRLGMRADDVPGGLQISAVDPGGLAALRGLKPGDKVIALDGGPASREALGAALKKRAAGGAPLELELERDGARVSVTINF